jgi:hypothetical protein
LNKKEHSIYWNSSCEANLERERERERGRRREREREGEREGEREREKCMLREVTCNVIVYDVIAGRLSAT